MTSPWMQLTNKSATEVALYSFARPTQRTSLHHLGGGFLFLESVYGFALALKSFEDGEQFGNLQQVTDALRQVGQFDVAARGARRGVQRDQSAESAAIDVADAAEIDNDIRFAFGDEALHHIAQRGGFVAKNDASVAGED